MLRALLAKECTLHGMFFAEKLGLFTDASWQDNVVFCFSRGAPGPHHRVERRLSRKTESDGSLVLEPLDTVVQAETSPDRLFNKRPEVVLALNDTVRLEELCYVTVGMVLNSDEALRDGAIVQVPASYDPTAIPIKRLSPAEQQPFIDLEKERHRLWSELKSLEREGVVLGKSVELPVHALMDRFRQAHPKRRHLTLAQAVAAGLFQMDASAVHESLRGARASGPSILLKKRIVATAGDQVQQKAAVAKVLARILSDLPATFAERQGIDKIPGTEDGLLALDAWLEDQKAAVEERQRRIEAIAAEIDRLAWELYRPAPPRLGRRARR